ncbi:Uncharacterised protein [Escherichia coli]|nr:Uncharacterised protein [Escherichia coli]
MIWPVQKTGLPYNIVRFPNGPLLRVPACFRGEWCSGGARKRRYGKYAYSPPVLFPMFLKVLIALENPCALMFSLKFSWFM